jgi:hypothetical protein
MILTLDLSPTEEARLAAAARQKGLDPAALVKALVTEHLPEPLPVPENSPEDPTLALFAQWAAEDAHKTPEETAQEDRLWEQFEANLNAERDRAEARWVF